MRTRCQTSNIKNIEDKHRRWCKQPLVHNAHMPPLQRTHLRRVFGFVSHVRPRVHADADARKPKEVLHASRNVVGVLPTFLFSDTRAPIKALGPGLFETAPHFFCLPETVGMALDVNDVDPREFDDLVYHGWFLKNQPPSLTHEASIYWSCPVLRSPRAGGQCCDMSESGEDDLTQFLPRSLRLKGDVLRVPFVPLKGFAWTSEVESVH